MPAAHLPWPLTEPAAQPPPARCDVLIVGASMAGLIAACALAEQGVHTVVLDGPGHRAGVWRGVGLRIAGLAEPTWRLEHAIGADRTRALLHLCNAPIVEPFITGPAYRVATRSEHLRQIDLEAEVLARLGADVQVQSASAAALLGPPVHGALRISTDAHLDVYSLHNSLVERALSAGVCLCWHHPVDHLGGIEPLAVGAWGSVRADMLVLAVSAAQRGLDPWLLDKLVPVREHGVHGTADHHAPASAGRDLLGYSQWRTDSKGRTLWSGARWASPHLEVGEEDDIHVNDSIVDALESAVRARGGTPNGAWSRIDTHTCDGLPILGPMPGSPDRVALTGFQGLELNFAESAARGVVQGMLTGTSDLPTWLSPLRFV